LTEHGAEYEEGRRDGRLEHIEKALDDLGKDHVKVRESHEKRLQYLERIAASLLAIVTFTTVLPGIVNFLASLSPK